jgi:hypothetical protein
LRLFFFILIAACIAPATTSAQCSAGHGTSVAPRVMVVGSAAGDSARLGALLGACWGNGSLLRSAPGLSEFPDSGGPHVSLVDPRLATVWNSEIPVTFNDGSLWAGRGFNTTLSAGAAGSYGRFRFMFIPRVDISQNRPFGVVPSGRADRSAFASPWHAGRQSADLPLRFGTERYATVDPGETMLESRVGPVAGGVTSAAAWWGPGIRNALLMSNNAAGIPQAYLRTARPVETRLGQVEGIWLLGRLSESPFFDRDVRNDTRALSAAAVTLRVAADTGLRLGMARAVYARARRFGRIPGHFADVFLDWHRRSASDSTATPAEQITSLFAKWTVPQAGLAAHLEWSRVRVPRSLRDLMVSPQEGQGFTVGLEWAALVAEATTLRIQSEFTSLEQTPVQPGVEVHGFYTSDLVAQGYTQRGQSVGAATGPGSSSQFLGGTLFRGRYQAGASLGRIRWEQDAYYRPPSVGVLTYTAHDVSLFAGLSAAADWDWGRAEVSWTRTLRMDFLFQTNDPFGFHDAFDVANHTLSLALTPHVPGGRKRAR